MKTSQNPQHLEASPSQWHAPYWKVERHGAAWERIKEALRRDWEQTKADFSSKQGRELDQSAVDTVKQAVGSAPIPPGDQANPPNVKTLLTPTWNEVEPGVSFGFAAYEEYGAGHSWDERLEQKLSAEWDAERTGQSFEAARPHIRRGWETKR